MTVTQSNDPKLYELLRLCDLGWKIFPCWWQNEQGVCVCRDGELCSRPGKHPRIQWQNPKEGRSGATNDCDHIKEWHQLWPEANWAVKLDEFFVLDADVKYGGLETIAQLDENMPELLGITLVQETPAGGRQYFYLQPPERDIQILEQGVLTKLPGFEIKGLRKDLAPGSYVLIPPSTGRRWLTTDSIAEASPYLLKIIRETVQNRQRASSGAEGVSGDTSEGFDFARAFTAGAIQPGEQQSTLYRAARSLRAQTANDSLAIATLRQIVNAFVNADPHNPWLVTAADEMWERVKKEVSAGRSDKDAIAKYKEWTANLVGQSEEVHKGNKHKGSDDSEDEQAQNDINNDSHTSDYSSNNNGSHAVSDVNDSEESYISVDDFVGLNEKDQQKITELGLGQLFVDLFKNHVRYSKDLGVWFVWNGIHWEQDCKKNLKVFALTQAVLRAKRDELVKYVTDEKDEDKRAEKEETAKKLISKLEIFEGHRKRSNVIETAASSPRVQTEIELFDAVPNLICARNGVIDLDTGRIVNSNPHMMISQCSAVDYDPRAQSPLLDQFIETFIPDEAEHRFIFAVLGHALRMGNPRRLLPIFWGESTSGKSQLFGALHKVLGNYVCAIGSGVFRGNLDDKPRPDLVNAMFKRIAYASEASKSWALHADQIKRLTGGDALPYRNLYEGVVNKIPRFTPMLVTNVFPRISGADNPLKRRILTIHFDRPLDPVREDPTVKELFLRDKQCLKALFARVILGARDSIIDYVPEKYALATMKARGDMDHVDEFLEWMCEEGFLIDVSMDTPASNCVKSSELYLRYTKWLKDFGDDIDKKQVLTNKMFSISLKEKGWTSKLSAGVRWLGKKLIPEGPIAHLDEWFDK